MSNKKEIPLFWWSERIFSFKDNENYGDLLSKYLVERISGIPVKWVHPKKQLWYKRNRKNLLGIGSILSHATSQSVVWGSGIIDEEHAVAHADFRAVRGPRTRSRLQSLGYECPKVFGDPALLLPRFYFPAVTKKYKLGIIPHYCDFKEVRELYGNEDNVLIIDLMTIDVERVTSRILQCERTISSSLHGLIVSHAYGIPSIWVEFSKNLFGDGVKFLDYLESVEIMIYNPVFLRERKKVEEIEKLFGSVEGNPAAEKIQELQKRLIESFPKIW